jgi:peptide/nickel transport system substrate-binding protein
LLDRAMSAKSLAPPQMSTGSFTSSDQFRIADDHAIEMTLPKPDRLGLADLCVPCLIMRSRRRWSCTPRIS